MWASLFQRTSGKSKTWGRWEIKPYCRLVPPSFTSPSLDGTTEGLEAEEGATPKRSRHFSDLEPTSLPWNQDPLKAV